jgi:hypothetical protein
MSEYPNETIQFSFCQFFTPVELDQSPLVLSSVLSLC